MTETPLSRGETNPLISEGMACHAPTKREIIPFVNGE